MYFPCPNSTKEVKDNHFPVTTTLWIRPGSRFLLFRSRRPERPNPLNRGRPNPGFLTQHSPLGPESIDLLWNYSCDRFDILCVTRAFESFPLVTSDLYVDVSPEE